MGYEISFKPTEEAMAKLKPWGDSYQSSTKKQRIELIAYCMRKSDEPTIKIYDNINFYLRFLKESVRTDERAFAYKRWKENEEKEIWYCGWEFSRPSSVDIDEVIEFTTQELTILTAVVETPDYFENNDKFYEKYREVIKRIDDFIDTMEEVTIHEIIEELDEFKEKYEEENDQEV